MIVKSSHGLCHLIHQTPSTRTLTLFAKKFNRNSASCKKLLFPKAAVTVAAPPLERRRITGQEWVLQSPMTGLDPPRLCSDHHHHQKKNGDDHLVLADRWNEIQGCHDWDALLDPIHPLLLSEIIRYGVFVRACYEAFDCGPGSKFHGSCKYGRKSLFGKLGMENCRYKVTKYIYATPAINVPDILKKKLEVGDGSNWIGYVAVSDDETEIKRLGRRDIVVAMRGTATYMEWLSNFMHTLTPARLNLLEPRDDVKVEMGFLGLYTSHDSTCRFNHGSARDQLLSEIARLVQKYKGEELSITITGHSMGSALAMLCAYDIAELELNRQDYESCKRIPITIYSFAGPRVGNLAFRDRCDELGLKILRVVNVHDVVTMIPGVLFNEKFRLWENLMDKNPWIYSHVGVELPIDHKLQPQIFKGKFHNPSCVHDLAMYLQVLTCCNHHSDRLYHRNDDHELHCKRNSNSGASIVKQLYSLF